MAQFIINETSANERTMAHSDFHVLNLAHFLKFSPYIMSNSLLILVTLYCMQFLIGGITNTIYIAVTGHFLQKF